MQHALKTTKKQLSAPSYRRLVASLDRLAGTRLKTTRETGGQLRTDSFGLIEGYTVISKTKSGLVSEFSVILSDWVYGSVLSEDILTISPSYFELSKSLERRIYEIARKACGTANNKWEYKLPTLYKMTGSTTSLKDFRYKIKAIATNDKLPDYHIRYDVETDKVLVRPRLKELEFTFPILAGDDVWLKKAKKAAPQLDIYALYDEWKYWSTQKGKYPKNPKAAFVGFCTKRYAEQFNKKYAHTTSFY